MNKRMELNSRRRLFIVDIENTVGNGVLGTEDVARVKSSMEAFYSIGEQDFVVIGVSHSNNVFPSHVWESARIVLKKRTQWGGRSPQERSQKRANSR